MGAAMGGMVGMGAMGAAGQSAEWARCQNKKQRELYVGRTHTIAPCPSWAGVRR